MKNIFLTIISVLFIFSLPFAHADDSVTVEYAITGVEGNTGGKLEFKKGDEPKQIKIPINENSKEEISVKLGKPSGGVTLNQENNNASIKLLSATNKLETSTAETVPRLEVEENTIESGSKFTVTPKGFTTDRSFTWSEQCNGGLTISTSGLATETESGSADPREYTAPYNQTNSDQDCTITLTDDNKIALLFKELGLENTIGDLFGKSDKKETASVTVKVKALTKPSVIATSELDDSGKKIYQLELKDFLDSHNSYVWTSECTGGLDGGLPTGNPGIWEQPENNTDSEQECTLSVTANTVVVSLGGVSAPSQSASVKVTVPVKAETKPADTTATESKLNVSETTVASGSKVNINYYDKGALPDKREWSQSCNNDKYKGEFGDDAFDNRVIPWTAPVNNEDGNLECVITLKASLWDEGSEEEDDDGEENYRIETSKITLFVKPAKPKKEETEATALRLNANEKTVESGGSFTVTLEGLSDGFAITDAAECKGGVQISKSSLGGAGPVGGAGPGGSRAGGSIKKTEKWNVSYHQSESDQACTVTYKNNKETASVTVKVKPIPELKIKVTEDKDTTDEIFYKLEFENTKEDPRNSNRWKKECPSGLETGRFGVTGSGTDGNYQEWYPPVNTTSSAVECTISVDHSPSSFASASIGGITYKRPSQSASVSIKIDPVLPIVKFKDTSKLELREPVTDVEANAPLHGSVEVVLDKPALSESSVTVSITGDGINGNDFYNAEYLTQTKKLSKGDEKLSFDYKVRNNDPDENDETFIITITDAKGVQIGKSNTISGTIINDSNNPPTAKNKTVTWNNTNRDEFLNIVPEIDDKDGDPLFVYVSIEPELGTVTWDSDGKAFQYKPNEYGEFTEKIEYFVTDRKTVAGSIPYATITINVNNPEPPLAPSNDQYELDEDTVLTVSAADGLLANDLYPKNAKPKLGAKPLKGQLKLNDDGSFEYAPDKDKFGTDGFSYTLVNDEFRSDEIARVDLWISPVNDAPVAVDVTVPTITINPKLQKQVVRYDLTKDVTDADGDKLTIKPFETDPNFIGYNFGDLGKVTKEGNELVFTESDRIPDPDLSLLSPDDNTTNLKFSYTVTDGKGGEDTASVLVTLNYVYSPPDYCAESPCQNGGQCINGDQAAICNCVVGYKGETCGEAVSTIAGTLEASKEVEPESKTTITTKGWKSATGVLDYEWEAECDGGTDKGSISNAKRNDDCAATPCLNGGICTIEQDHYQCSCTTDFYGTNCEFSVEGSTIAINNELKNVEENSITWTAPKNTSGEVRTCTITYTGTNTSNKSSASAKTEIKVKGVIKHTAFAERSSGDSDRIEDNPDTAEISFAIGLSDKNNNPQSAIVDTTVSYSVIPKSDGLDKSDFKDDVLPSGKVTIPKDSQAEYIKLYIKADADIEEDEKFEVQVSDADPNDGVEVTTSSGGENYITILNDDYCAENTCKNGGQCSNDAANKLFICACEEGFEGETCDKVANNPPVLEKKIENVTISIGEDFNIELRGDEFSDKDGDSLKYKLEAGISKDLQVLHGATKNSAAIGAIIREKHIGTHTIKVIAYDGKGGEESTSFKLTVKAKPVTVSIATKDEKKQEATGGIYQEGYTGSTDTLSFTVSLNQAASKEVNIPYTLTGIGKGVVKEELKGIVVIAKEEKSKDLVFSLTNEIAVEKEQTVVTVTLGDASGAKLGEKKTATGTIYALGDIDQDGAMRFQGDCKEGDGTVFPGADEVCDKIDNDCDGAIDEGFDASCNIITETSTTKDYCADDPCKNNGQCSNDLANKLFICACEEGFEGETCDKVANKPPIVQNKIDDQVFTIGQQDRISIDVNVFSDPDGDVLNYSSSKLPGELRADFTKPAPEAPVQPRIEGKLTKAAVGEHTITITAKDGKGGEESKSFKLTIKPAKQKAVTLDAPGKVSSNQSVSITVRDLYSGYSISSECEGLKDSGKFTSNYLDRNDWEAPVNETGEDQTCTITVTHPDYNNEITKDIIVSSAAPSKKTDTSTSSKETTDSKVVNKTVSVSQTIDEKEDKEGNRELTFTIELSCPTAKPVECSANTCAAMLVNCGCPDGKFMQIDGSCIDGNVQDFDGDGFTAADGDCTEGDANVSPNAMEICDGQDNDCDGDVDEEEYCQ